MRQSVENIPPKVSNPNKFPEDSLIGYFMGKNYADALQQAVDWASSSGATLSSYYEQVAFGKSILVSYKIGDTNVR